MRIWKWRIDVTDMQTVIMPIGAKLLDVQMQNGECCIWALCDHTAPTEPRTIAIYGTGNQMPEDHGEYIATFQMRGGALVFHAFEVEYSQKD